MNAAVLTCKAAKATDLATTLEEEIIICVYRAAEQRDNETGNQIQRMATLCRILSDGLGLNLECCSVLTRSKQLRPPVGNYISEQLNQLKGGKDECAWATPYFGVR